MNEDLIRFNFLLDDSNREVLMSREYFYDYLCSFSSILNQKNMHAEVMAHAKTNIKYIRSRMLEEELKKSNKPRIDAQRFISKKAVRQLIFKIHGKKCLCCNSINKISLDHIVPVFLNGKNEIDNLQPLCNICNSRKGINVIDYRKEVYYGNR